MKILVYDIAAEDGGGLFVLRQFFKEVLEMKDSNKWFFLVSNGSIQSTDNILVINNENVKKSYFHRWIFETVQLKKILKDIAPDLIISLQNMPIRGCNVKQFTYLHQSLQYCPKKFSLLKPEERGLAVRQKIICNIYKRNLPKSEHIFVQTNWIKEATKKWLNMQNDQITVVPVAVNVPEDLIREYEGQKSNIFFYPARAEMYKNHNVIIGACKKLVKSGITNFKVLFTIKKEDSPYAAKIVELCQNLPIEFIGAVPYREIWNYYRKTILLFPSYLETCGLPMLEAKAAGGRILASDMPFSHENLDGYENVMYFHYNDIDELAKKMRMCLENPHYTSPNGKRNENVKGLVESMMEKL